MCLCDCQHQGGVDWTEGQEGGTKSETDGERQQVRDTEGFLKSEKREREKKQVYGVLARSLVHTDKPHLSTFQQSKLTAYSNS